MSRGTVIIEIENVPSNCRRCEFKGAITERNFVYCELMRSWVRRSDERPINCPIKEETE